MGKKTFASSDCREQDRLRFFSSLGIKPPRTKKEKYKLAAMLRKVKKER